MLFQLRTSLAWQGGWGVTLVRSDLGVVTSGKQVKPLWVLLRYHLLSAASPPYLNLHPLPLACPDAPAPLLFLHSSAAFTRTLRVPSYVLH